MIRLTLTTLATGLVVAGSASGQVPSEPSPACPSAHDYKVALKRTYRYTARGGNYRARKPWPRRVHKLRDMRACAKANHTGEYPQMRHELRRRLTRWRFHRHIDRLTPWGEWAIPTYIVSCETGGTYSYTIWNRSGSGASGVYQIMHGTWLGLGGGRWASNAAYAPAWAQHIVAHRLYLRRGTQPWSCR